MQKAKKCARIMVVITCWILAIPVGAQDLTVTKQKRTQNPTLVLSSFSGPAEVRQQLVSDLTISDWFQVLPVGQEADYSLQASYSQLNGVRELTMHLQDRQGETVSHFRQRAQDDRTNWLVHYAVDALIERVFDNPGFCATLLAFVRQNGLVKEIFYSDFDGRNAVQLTYNNGLSVEPAWRPDGKYLMYTKYERLSTSIILVDLVRQEQRRLISSPGLNAGAAFSHNGRWAAVTMSREGNVELYRMSLLDNTLLRLFSTRGVETSPTWSPDDQRICFVSDSFIIPPTLGVVSADGGRPRQLLSLPFEAVSPDWSTVSNQICFSLRQGRRYTIAVLDMNDPQAEPRVIVKAAGDWEAPNWAADGRHIVCSRNHQGRQSLYLVDSWYGTMRELKAVGELSLPSYSNRF